MGRPSSPLIDRAAALETALEIVDLDGIEALSIRRLGAELGVNGTSLYHHFASKEEILEGVRRLVLADIRVPEARDVAWQTWVADSARSFRAALLRHPNTAPLMIVSPERQFGLSVRAFSVEILARGGVPAAFLLPITDSVETLAFGAAMINPTQQTPAERLGERIVEHPILMTAAEADTLSADEHFELALAALLDGWSDLIEQRSLGLGAAGGKSG